MAGKQQRILQMHDAMGATHSVLHSVHSTQAGRQARVQKLVAAMGGDNEEG